VTRNSRKSTPGLAGVCVCVVFFAYRRIPCGNHVIDEVCGRTAAHVYRRLEHQVSTRTRMRAGIFHQMSDGR